MTTILSFVLSVSTSSSHHHHTDVFSSAQDCRDWCVILFLFTARNVLFVFSAAVTEEEYDLSKNITAVLQSRSCWIKQKVLKLPQIFTAFHELWKLHWLQNSCLPARLAPGACSRTQTQVSGQCRLHLHSHCGRCWEHLEYQHYNGDLCSYPHSHINPL